MSRQETSNTFSEGLIKDLNPINTPNTALTDCVNGTIITYDGNEYSLQNDRGNYALRHCKLKPNYIPVGVKEYGDILYIVSYNPLDEHVEIGSYPSPETITDANDVPGLKFDDAIISIATALQRANKTSVTYQEIIENYSKLNIFYGARPDKTKMYAGDEIIMHVDANAGGSSFEKLQYVLVDENRQITDITDKMDAFINASKYKPIAWGPGWVGFKPVVAELSDNIINVKTIKVPSYGQGSATLSFNVRVTTSDSLFINNEETLSKLKARIHLVGKNASGVTTDIINRDESLSQYLNVKNGEYYYYTNDIKQSIGLDLSRYTSLELTVVPILKLTDNIIVTYSHLERTSLFNLTKKADPSTFTLGNSYWKWSVDSETIAIMFDTSGLTQSSVLDSDVSLYYSITDLNNNPIGKWNINGDSKTFAPYTNCLCAEWNIVGDTTIELPAATFNKENYTECNTLLYPENIYKITFEIKDGDGNRLKLFDTPKLIIASSLFNKFSEARFDTISVDTWLSNYVDSIQNKLYSVTGSRQGDWNTSISYPECYNIWMNPNNIFTNNEETYKTFLTDAQIQDICDDEKPFIKWISTCRINAECKSTIKLLTGPMWLDFNKKCRVYFNDAEVRFDEYTGLLKSGTTIITPGSASKTITCIPTSMGGECDIWSYEEVQPNYRELEIAIDGKHSLDGNIKINNKQRKNLSLKVNVKSGSSTITAKEWSIAWGTELHSTTAVDNTIIPNAINLALKDYDLGLIKLNVGQINDRNGYCNIGMFNKTNGTTSTLINNDGKSGWDFEHAYLYCMAIKLNNGVLFIEIPNTYSADSDAGASKAVTQLSRFCSEVKKVNSGITSTSGGFWKLSLGDTKIDTNTNVTITSKLLLADELKINNIDFFNRSDIINANLGLNTNVEKFILDTIELSSENNRIAIDADFTSTQAEEETIKTKVLTRNTQIEREVSMYSANKNYAAGFTPGSIYTPNGTTFGNRMVLLYFMNNKTFNGDGIIYAEDSYTDWSENGTISRKLGQMNPSIKLQ